MSSHLANDGGAIRSFLLSQSRERQKSDIVGYWAVAYAGFWKGGGPKISEIWEEQRSESEVVPLKFRPIFRPNIGEEQKKKKKKVFTQGQSRFSPELTQISSQKPDAQLTKGGPCLNFAHFTMQFCNPSDPKGGPWPNGPPLNTPLILGDSPIKEDTWTELFSFALKR